MSLQRLALASFLLTGWTVGMCAGATPYFASLPVGEWVDIPNSALGLSPLFGPYPPETCVNGIEGRSSIYDSWGSGALDTNADRLLIRGGGHGAYAGNEMYAFDFRTLQWERPFDGSPADTIPCPPPDDKDYETYPPSSPVDVEGAGLGSNPNRVWFVGDTQADGTLHPSARHAYGGFFFDPDLNTANQIGGAHYAQGGRSNSVWSYDLTSRRWQRIPDIPEGDYGDVGAFDPLSHRIYHVGKMTFNVFDDTANAWTTLNDNPGPVDEWGSDDRRVAAIVPERRWMIVLGRGQIWVFHLDTGQMWVQPTTGPSPSYPASIAHVPGSDTVHIWSGTTPTTLFELDLSTWRFYPITPTTGATPFVSGNFRTLNRFGYDPEQGVFYVTDAWDAPISVFKPSFAPALEGNVDRVDCTSIGGWAWDARKDGTRLGVDITSDGVLIGAVVANMFSQALLDGGKGDGSHQFRFDVPRSLQDGHAHAIQVKYSGTSTVIPASVSTLTCAGAPPPSAPTGLVASGGGSQISLSWNDTSNNETGFRVERRAAGESTYSTLALLGQDAHSYDDQDLPAMTQFFYRVFAFDNGGDSLPSNEANATTGASHPFVNGGFEAPDANGSYAYQPDGAIWTFTAGAGISANDTAFTNGNTPAPEGQQVAFLQQSGSVSQTADIAAGQYAVSFMAAQRRNYAVSNQVIAVKVDGTAVAQFQPTLDYTRFTTPPFTLATGGNHAITLTGLAPTADFTAFVDDVRIVALTGNSLSSSANPAMTGSALTFTASISGIAPTGTVSFTDSGVSLPGCTDVPVEGVGNSRAASCTVTAGAVGNHIILAQYGGDANNSASGSAPLVQVVNATTAVFANGGFETPDLGGGYAYGPPGSGWVFYAGAGISADNTAFTAGNGPAPEGRQVALLQGAGAISQAANFSAGRYVLTLTAAQRLNYALGTQVIAVQLDGSTVGQFEPPAGPYAVFSTPGFSITSTGNHTISLVGAGSGSDFTALVDDVRVVAESTTTLATSANPSTAGSSLSLTSTVSGASPSGIVSFMDGATPIAGCASVALAGSGTTKTAACRTAELQVGMHNIVASYGGDGANGGSSSSVVTQLVTGNPSNVPPAVTLTAPGTGASYVAPASIALSATASDSDGTVTKVEFLQGSSVIATLTTAPYTFNWTNVGPGNYSLAARATDDGMAVTTSAAVLVTVSPAAPGLVNGGFETPDLGGGYEYGPAGATWTFAAGGGISANLTGFTSGNGAAPEGGQVAFIQASGRIAQTATIAAGQYTLSLMAAQRQNSQSGTQVIAVQVDGVTVGQYQPPGVAYSSFTSAPFTITSGGNHTITLLGVGSGNDYTAFVDDVRLVNWNGPVNTTTTVASSSNPAFVGATLTFTATVNGTSPTGTVAFADGGTILAGCAAVPLDVTSSTASCSTGSLSAGTHTIAAVYGGDASNLSSGSSAISQVVSATAPTFGNGGFETPDLGGGFEYGPADATWVLANGGGISANDTGFTSGNSAAPEGKQVGFLQVGGSMVQTANIPAGEYTLSLLAAQRQNSQSGTQVIAIRVDGVTVGQYQPPGVAYSSFTTAPFTITSGGNHTITLLGVGSGNDYTAFVDDVRLTIH